MTKALAAANKDALGCFVFAMKIALIVGPSPLGDGPFVRNLSSFCQEYTGLSSSLPASDVSRDGRSAAMMRP